MYSNALGGTEVTPCHRKTSTKRQPTTPTKNPAKRPFWQHLPRLFQRRRHGEKQREIEGREGSPGRESRWRSGSSRLKAARVRRPWLKEPPVAMRIAQRRRPRYSMSFVARCVMRRRRNVPMSSVAKALRTRTSPSASCSQRSRNPDPAENNSKRRPHPRPKSRRYCSYKHAIEECCVERERERCRGTRGDSGG